MLKSMNKCIILKPKLVSISDFLFELSLCHCNFLEGFPRICKTKTVLTPTPLISQKSKALKNLNSKINLFSGSLTCSL